MVVRASTATVRGLVVVQARDLARAVVGPRCRADHRHGAGLSRRHARAQSRRGQASRRRHHADGQRAGGLRAGAHDASPAVPVRSRRRPLPHDLCRRAAARRHRRARGLSRGPARVARAAPAMASRLRVHFVGTGTSPDDPEDIRSCRAPARPASKRWCDEHPHRIGYVDTLNHLERCGAVLVLGSTERHYTPSKVFQAILSKRPVFAMLHAESTAVGMIDRRGPGRCCRLTEQAMPSPPRSPLRSGARSTRRHTMRTRSMARPSKRYSAREFDARHWPRRSTRPRPDQCGEGGMSLRIGFLVSHPIQYYAPIFRALAKRCDLTVFFAHRQTAEGQAKAGYGVTFQWDVDLLSGYDSHTLTNVSRQPSTDLFCGLRHARTLRRRSRRAGSMPSRSGLGTEVLSAGGACLPPARRAGTGARRLPTRQPARRRAAHGQGGWSFRCSCAASTASCMSASAIGSICSITACCRTGCSSRRIASITRPSAAAAEAARQRAAARSERGRRGCCSSASWSIASGRSTCCEAAAQGAGPAGRGCFCRRGRGGGQAEASRCGGRCADHVPRLRQSERTAGGLCRGRRDRLCPPSRPGGWS